MFHLLMPSLAARQALISHLAAHGILAVFHYLPLHLSKFGLRYGGRAGDQPVTEEISDRLLRLPYFCALTEEEQTRVIQAVCEFKP
jgi:dTDP-4-amino-4,6-dideoxygalactose transaminase